MAAITEVEKDMTTKTTKEIDAVVPNLKDQIAQLRTQIDEKRGSLADLQEMRGGLRARAIRNGDSRARTDLDLLRTTIYSLQLERDDLQEEIRKVEIEIADLQALRVDVAKDESWSQFMSQS